MAHRLEHIPEPAVLEPTGLPSGLYENATPKEVQELYSRGNTLGPCLMKPGIDDFCFMLTSLNVLNRKDQKEPQTVRFNRFKAQNTKYYRDLEVVKAVAEEEDEDDE